jgi:MoaA/NifB/PqqE/SkfB family radical SAM enzyme
MGTYYRFLPNVFFVKGGRFGAIYNCNDGVVYWINEEGRNNIEQNLEDAEFWDQLLDLGLVEQASSPAALPDLPKDDSPSLKFAWFELNGKDCNESCQHCYADSMPPTKRRALGLPALEESYTRKLSFSEWKLLITQAYELGARSCQFIGGEPTLYSVRGEGDWLDLCQHARDIGFEMIEVYTNATMLTEPKILKMKELGLNVAVSLYSYDEAVHDDITNTPGSHRMTMKNLALLKKHGLKVRIGIIMMRPNEATTKQTIELVDSMGFEGGSRVDPLRPKGRGDRPWLFPSLEATALHGIMLEPNFTASRSMLAQYSTSHSCVGGKVTIVEDGSLLSCIFADRTNPSSSVITLEDKVSLSDGLSRQGLQSRWNHTKDQVEVCSRCEYRYGCFDCLELDLVNGGKAPYRCSYNPDTGQWAEGLWRLDKEGNPFYDEQYGPALQLVAAEKAAKFEEPLMQGH